MTPEEFEKSIDATEKTVDSVPAEIDLNGKLNRKVLYAMGINKETSTTIMKLHDNSVRYLRDYSRKGKREQLINAIDALLQMLNFDQLQKAFLKIFYLYNNDQSDAPNETPKKED